MGVIVLVAVASAMSSRNQCGHPGSDHQAAMTILLFLLLRSLCLGLNLKCLPHTCLEILIIFNFVYMCVCVFGHAHLYAVPIKAKRGRQIPWRVKGSYERRILGTEFRSLARAVYALNC